MRLAAENLNLRKIAGDAGALRMLAEAGFEGVDYSFYGLEAGDDLLEKSDAGLKDFAARIKEEAERHSLALLQAHATFNFKYGENFDSPNYTDILKSLRAAGALGIPHIVVHSVKCPCGVDSDKVNREYYRSFIPYCEEYGIKIAVENLFKHDKLRERYDGILSTPEWMTSFVKSLESDRFITCLDLGHTALSGVEPETYIRGMSPDLLLALHVQDVDYRGDRHWLPYFGKLNWDEITKALGEIGYRGDLTFEILHFIDRYPPDFLPEALRFAAVTGKYLISKIEAARR